MVDISPGAARSDSTLLGVYLNDHAAGAIGGIELARRIARSHCRSANAETLARIAADIADDRSALLAVMAKLGIPVRRYKGYVAWAAEKVSRLKFNGRLFSRSPLSGLLELEALLLGVRGKAALWRTLWALTDQDSRLDGEQLETLSGRARQQIDTLERLRMHTALEAFSAIRT
ncbi:MAG: hypothetical protein ACR2NT_12490 [Acidimicrobiia bacterium]|jgi:hypothetical protein